MADFFDSDVPGYVYAQTSGGPQLVDRSVVGPNDTVMPGNPAGAPVPAPALALAPVPVAVSTAPARTGAELVAKRDAVLGQPAPARAPQLPIAQTSTTTQSAIPSGVLNPVLERNTAGAESVAQAALKAGDERAQRGEQAAMVDTANAYGRYQQADQARRDQAQRAEIARQNELAVSLQKDPNIDPDHFVNSLSTGQQIAAVLLATLNGGFKGAQGQSGNDVMDILQKRIAQDIDAQKDQIQSGRIRRGNLVSYFQNQGMRAEDAAKAAEATTWAMLDRMASAEKDRIGAGEHSTTAELFAAQTRQQAAQKNDELRLSLGTPRSTTTTVRERPQSADSRPGDIGKMADDMKGARDIEQLRNSGLTEPEYQKQANEYSEKAQKNDDLVNRAREVAQALGGDLTEVRDQKGNVTGYKVVGDFDTPHFGDQATRYESALSNLQRADVMGMAREPSAALQDQFAKATEMPIRDEQKKVRLQQVLDMALRERQTLAAGYNEHVVGAVDGRKSARSGYTNPLNTDSARRPQ